MADGPLPDVAFLDAVRLDRVVSGRQRGQRVLWVGAWKSGALFAIHDVRRTLGQRTIRFVDYKPLRAGQSNRLVIADHARSLASGDVLHRLSILRQTRWEWTLETVFVMKSHIDDAWISAATERGVQIRLRNYIRMLEELPAPVVPEEPYRPLSEEERLDELAYADVFA